MITATATKAAVSLTEMAAMVGLSRSRFYQLMGTAFPWPQYDIVTRRPIFPEEIQQVCLEVRRRNCGIDGRPILFHCRAPRPIAPPQRANTRPRRTATPPSSPAATANTWLVDALAALGLNVNTAQAEAAQRASYPNGTTGIDQGEVIRAVFLHCRSQNSAGNAGR
jgi:hypothetical protein